MRRAFKGGDPPRINPLVDFYNAVSLRHVVPAGGFDLEEIDGTLELRLTRTGDTARETPSIHWTALLRRASEKARSPTPAAPRS